MKPVPFNKPFIIGRELALIADAVAQGHLSGDGPYTKLCHRWFEDKLGCRKALLTHSCTGALEMAAILCDIQPGDEVILPSYTFVSTANAFVLRGAVPVFVDIRPDTLNIDETLIEGAITPRTKAIVPVHYAGVPCEMDTIMDIAQRHKLLVIEDAAQALLSTYKGRALGSIGHFGCLSFHETKNIISGEGGALLMNDVRFAEPTAASFSAAKWTNTPGWTSARPICPANWSAPFCTRNWNAPTRSSRNAAASAPLTPHSSPRCSGPGSSVSRSSTKTATATYSMCCSTV
jgi:TDP-4-keto-6-deoxy-D-glucose transaminase